MTEFSEPWICDFLARRHPNERHRPQIQRLARVVWLRCGERKTYVAIGAELGVSRARARQLFMDALWTMRRGMTHAQYAEVRAWHVEAISTGHEAFLDALLGEHRT